MASESTTHCHIRSVSLPCRSHPTTLEINEELNRIKALEITSSTSAAICSELCRLADLYNCMDDLLNLPQTIQALSKHQNQKWGEEFLDRSLKLVDICGISREVVSQFKENVRHLQSSLRRRKGDSSIHTSISNYTSIRKKMKKDAQTSISALKQIDESSTILNLEDQHLSSLIRVLREVNSTSMSILRGVLLFLSAQTSKQRPSKWSLVYKLVNKRKVGCENDQEEAKHELESVDSALRNLYRSEKSENEKVQLVQNRLGNLEASIEGVENGLEGLFRCLIRSRTSLLNIFS